MIEEVEKIIKEYEKNNIDLKKLQEKAIQTEEELYQLRQEKNVDNGEFEKKLKERLQARKDRDVQEIEKSENEFIGDVNTKIIEKQLLEEEYQKRFEEEMKVHEEKVKEETKKRKAKIRSKDKQLKEKNKKIEDKKIEIESIGSDENIKTITMGIIEIDKKINSKNIELARKKLEISEYNDNLLNNVPEKNSKNIYELYKEQEEIQKEIENLQKDKEKYSEYLELLKGLRFKSINIEEDGYKLLTEEEKQDKTIDLADALENDKKQEEKAEATAQQENNEIIAEEVIEENKEDKQQEKNISKIVDDRQKVIIDPAAKVQTKKEIEPVVEEENNENIEIIEIKETIPNYSVKKIIYNAKTDKYTIIDSNDKELAIVKREEVEKVDSTNILEDEDVSKNIENLDINIIKLLRKFDKMLGTSKTMEYIKIAEMGKSQEERKQAMEESDLAIEYNLKGLYAEKAIEGEYDEYEEVFSKQERKELLTIANNAKRKGMATVKKGIYVTIREKLDNIANRFNNIKWIASIKEKLALPKGNEEQEELENAEGETYYDKMLSEAEKFRESKKISKKEQKAIDEKNKILENQAEALAQSKGNAEKFKGGAVWENGNVVPKTNTEKEEEERV